MLIGFRGDGESTGIIRVKRLIRNKRTKKFLTSAGTWTSNVSSAQDFATMRAVIKAEQEHDLTGVELFLVMENKPSIYDVVLPLGDGKGTPNLPKRDGVPK